MKVKNLIKQLQGIPNTCEIVGFDIKLLDTKNGLARQLFSIPDEVQENEPKEEKPNKIGF